jgi:hypothetical protein
VATRMSPSPRPARTETTNPKMKTLTNPRDQTGQERENSYYVYYVKNRTPHAYARSSKLT